MRGLTAQQLKNSTWFTGPKFLWQCELTARELKVGVSEEDDPEIRKSFVCNTKAMEEKSFVERFKKFSDWSRVVKAVTRLRRQISEYKDKKQKTNECTSLEERKEAELVIVKLVQENAFPELIKNLKQKNANIKTKDRKLCKLSPFLDEDGILRVGGRLKHATLHPFVKHPALLPKNSHTVYHLYLSNISMRRPSTKAVE